MAVSMESDRPRQAAIGAWVPGAALVLLATLATGGTLGNAGWPGRVYLTLVLMLLMPLVMLGSVLVLRALLGAWRVPRRGAYFAYLGPMLLALTLTLIPVVGWIVGGALSVWVPMSWVARHAERAVSVTEIDRARTLAVTPIEGSVPRPRGEAADALAALPPPLPIDRLPEDDDEEGGERPALW